MTAIDIQHLSKTYTKRNGAPVQAVRDLSLAVQPGEILGFLGANGAGKTTTIKMMCGLVEPSAGRVQLNGFDLQRQRSAAMVQIGAVLEGTRNIYWRLSAWQNLMYFGRLKGERTRTIKARAERLLRDLHLWERRYDPVREFSRGMQQKVAIACALIADPPIVLLDEPTLGLDVQAARTVKEWVRELVRAQGKTVVLTTHQLDMAQELCDRIAIMREGKLITIQPTAALLDLFRQNYYTIRVDGRLEPDGREIQLDALSLSYENGHTIIAGPIEDQVHLHHLLDSVRRARLPLVSVQRDEPKLEDVFVQLMEIDRDTDTNPETAQETSA